MSGKTSGRALEVGEREGEARGGRIRGKVRTWSTKSSAGRFEYSTARVMAVSKAVTTFVPSDAEQ